MAEILIVLAVVLIALALLLAAFPRLTRSREQG
jgi:type II secretory pathway pseudopilin PulG